MERTGQITVGIVVLAVACGLGAYGGVAITALTMGVLGGVGMLVSLVLPLGVALLLVAGGMRRGKSGYAWAPVLFFGGWALISVVMRVYLSFEAAKIMPPDIDPSLAKIKTLVVDDYLNFSRTFVTEGVVDRQVEIGYTDNDRAKPINSIKQTTLASGEACSKDDPTFELRTVGRIDECFKITKLATVPDGLHILHAPYNRQTSAWSSELKAVVVENGQKADALKWRRISARVPAYVPLFMMNMGPFNRAQSVWETRQGPFEVVSYGDVNLTSQAMAGAIYAFDPSLPPKPKDNSVSLAKHAYELVSAGDHRSGLSIVALLDRAGFVDDNMIKAAAYNILVDGSPSVLGGRLPDLGKFADKLNAGQRNLLNDEILRLLTTPAECRCRAFLFNSTELGQRAVDAFQNTSGLELWQYDGLLTATMYVATPFQDHRQQLFASIMASHDPSNARRMIAYLNRAGVKLLEQEMRALVPKLADLDTEGIFLIATHSATLVPPSRAAKFDSTFDPELNLKADTWAAFWAAMRSQADRIPDAKQRARAIDEIGKKQLES